MAQVSLDNLAGTGFYVPAAPAAEGPMLFLRWSGATAAPITLDGAWSEPAMAGYFLFLSEMPTALEAVETAVRAKLGEAPAVSSFAWVEIDSGTVGRLNPLLLGPGEGIVRLVKSDFVATGFPQFPSVPVAAGTGVRAVADGDGFVQGATILYPPLAAFGGQPAAGPPWSAGISLPLTGAGTGCLRFEGVIDHGAAPLAGAIQKDIWELSLDPLDAFDPDRTYLRPTGRFVLLSQSGSGGPFALEGAPPE